MTFDAIAVVQLAPITITLGYVQVAGLWDTQPGARKAWNTAPKPARTDWKVKNAVDVHQQPWS